MTLAAVGAVLFPYLRNTKTITDASDLEVYKDQLTEIDADEKRGLISQEEAVTARLEVSRRILKADELRGSLPDGSTGQNASALLVCAAIIVPLAAWGLYGSIGAAGMLDQPIAARLNVQPADASVEVLVAKAEAHLQANPNDGRGWAVLAPIYVRLNRYDDAIKAYQMAGKLNGVSTDYEIGIGKAWTAKNGGVPNDEARAAYKRASQIDPNNPEPKMLLAVDLAEQRRFPEAKVAFQAILDSAPENAPWRGILVDMIARVDKAILAKTGTPQPGPTQNDVEQAEKMSDADRKTMIEGMVSQLDAKLTANPADVAGWIRLIQSYMVLKNRDKALDAFERAKAGLKDNASGLTEVNAFALKSGLVKE